MRYLQGKSLEETGSAMGISVTAASKTTHRALEKLRARLARVGLTWGAATLAVMLAEGGAKAAPAVLAPSVTLGATSSGALGAAGTAKSLLLAKGAGAALAESSWKS